MLSRGSQVGIRAFQSFAAPRNGAQSMLRLSLSPLREPLQLRPLSITSSSLRTTRILPKNDYGMQECKAISVAFRKMSTTPVKCKEAAQVNTLNDQPTDLAKRDNPEDITLGFKRTEKGEAAREVDLSARLKDRSASEKGEVIRLLRLAGREWRTLTGIHYFYPS